MHRHVSAVGLTDFIHDSCILYERENDCIPIITSDESKGHRFALQIIENMTATTCFPFHHPWVTAQDLLFVSIVVGLVVVVGEVGDQPCTKASNHK